MVRSEDVTTVTEHLAHLTDHLRQVRDTGRPMFIETDGKTQAVVLSPAAYDQLAREAETARSLKMLDQSMDDIRAGRVQPADQAIDDIAREFGLKLERNPARP